MVPSMIEKYEKMRVQTDENRCPNVRASSGCKSSSKLAPRSTAVNSHFVNRAADCNTPSRQTRAPGLVRPIHYRRNNVPLCKNPHIEPKTPIKHSPVFNQVKISQNRCNDTTLDEKRYLKMLQGRKLVQKVLQEQPERTPVKKKIINQTSQSDENHERKYMLTIPLAGKQDTYHVRNGLTESETCSSFRNCNSTSPLIQQSKCLTGGFRTFSDEGEKLIGCWTGVMTLITRLILAGLTWYEVQYYCPKVTFRAGWILKSVLAFLYDVLVIISVFFDKCNNVGLLLAATKWLDKRMEIVVIMLMAFHGLYHPSKEVISKFFPGTWHETLHICFVCAFLIRCLYSSFRESNRMARRNISECKGRRIKLLLMCLSRMTVWVFILPLFQDCELELNESTSFCFFAMSNPKQIKGKSEYTTRILRPRYSFADIIAIKLHQWMLSSTRTKIRSQLWKELQYALLSPFQFRGRLQTFFAVIRWAKFLVPLFGTCNKLRGHILDMIRKKRQRHASWKARKKWDEVVLALLKQSRIELAVLRLQKRFLEKKERKAKRRFELMTPTPCWHISHKHWKRFREEHRYIKSRLDNIQTINNRFKKRRLISEDELSHIARHKETSRKRLKQLLLSPKTSFAVRWKYVTVACVALEIAQVLFSPLLSGEMRKMPLDQFVSSLLFAKNDQEKNRKSVVPNIFVPMADATHGRTCLSTISHKYIWLLAVRVIVSLLVPIVNIVFFLDVFITFFTGELTESGVLVPKPFFARYIIPGIGLQLIVNPTMSQISRLVKKALTHAIQIGPSLCFHLILALIPFLASCFDSLLNLALDFVERQNNFVSRRHSLFLTSGLISWEEQDS